MPANSANSNDLIRPRMPELDCLRGIAILAVLFYHGFFWSNDGLQGLSGFGRIAVAITAPGWLGVNLFFVLSGFLITGRLLDTKSARNYFARFYIRRALRILPAYYLLLALLVLTGSQNHLFLGLSFLYLSNLVWLIGVPMTYPVLWSLAVEEHFYIFWPFIVRGFSNRRLLQCALAIVCVVPILRSFAAYRGWLTGINTYTWLVADSLAMGAVLAAYVRDRAFSQKGLAQICGGAIFLSGVLVVAGHVLDPRFPVLMYALRVTKANLAFTALLGFTLLLGSSRWALVARRSFLLFFGDISYGLYLFHMLIFEAYDGVARRYWPALFSFTGHFQLLAIRFVAGAMVAIAFAYVSRRYFEEPFLRLKSNNFSANLLVARQQQAYESSAD